MQKNFLETEGNKIIGKRLREGREEKKLNMREAEYLTGINKMTLSRIERGTRSANSIEIVKLCNLYDLTAEDLFWGLL